MKNLSKFDRFMLSGLAFIVILGTALACKSCNAQESPKDIPTMEYYDASGEEFDLDHDGAILLFPDGVIDFIYHTQDNEYVIEYDDPDAFDPDNMIYDSINNYYYIEIYCDSDLFFEYLSYYNNLGGYDNPEFFEASDEYFIEEDYLSDDEPFYKLVKYANKEDN